MRDGWKGIFEFVDLGLIGIAGKEGAPAKEGMTGALDGTKKTAEELAGKGS